eukprot:m.217760 g.217760  ORF g.217760 m.217760 type:complete len:1682 (+) comp16990_c1_seq2:125-5170(+)
MASSWEKAVDLGLSPLERTHAAHRVLHPEFSLPRKEVLLWKWATDIVFSQKETSLLQSLVFWQLIQQLLDRVEAETAEFVIPRQFLQAFTTVGKLLDNGEFSADEGLFSLIGTCFTGLTRVQQPKLDDLNKCVGVFLSTSSKLQDQNVNTYLMLPILELYTHTHSQQGNTRKTFLSVSQKWLPSLLVLHQHFSSLRSVIEDMISSTLFTQEHLPSYINACEDPFPFKIRSMGFATPQAGTSEAVEEDQEAEPLPTKRAKSKKSKAAYSRVLFQSLTAMLQSDQPGVRLAAHHGYLVLLRVLAKAVKLLSSALKDTASSSSSSSSSAAKTASANTSKNETGTAVTEAPAADDTTTASEKPQQDERQLISIAEAVCYNVVKQFVRDLEASLSPEAVSTIGRVFEAFAIQRMYEETVDAFHDRMITKWAATVVARLLDALCHAPTNSAHADAVSAADAWVTAVSDALLYMASCCYLFVEPHLTSVFLQLIPRCWLCPGATHKSSAAVLRFVHHILAVYAKLRQLQFPGEALTSACISLSQSAAAETTHVQQQFSHQPHSQAAGGHVSGRLQWSDAAATSSGFLQQFEGFWSSAVYSLPPGQACVTLDAVLSQFEPQIKGATSKRPSLSWAPNAMCGMALWMSMVSALLTSGVTEPRIATRLCDSIERVHDRFFKHVAHLPASSPMGGLLLLAKIRMTLDVTDLSIVILRAVQDSSQKQKTGSIFAVLDGARGSAMDTGTDEQDVVEDEESIAYRIQHLAARLPTVDELFEEHKCVMHSAIASGALLGLTAFLIRKSTLPLIEHYDFVKGQVQLPNPQQNAELVRKLLTFDHPAKWAHITSMFPLIWQLLESPTDDALHASTSNPGLELAKRGKHSKSEKRKNQQRQQQAALGASAETDKSQLCKAIVDQMYSDVTDQWGLFAFLHQTSFIDTSDVHTLMVNALLQRLADAFGCTAELQMLSSAADEQKLKEMVAHMNSAWLQPISGQQVPKLSASHDAGSLLSLARGIRDLPWLYNASLPTPHVLSALVTLCVRAFAYKAAFADPDAGLQLVACLMAAAGQVGRSMLSKPKWKQDTADLLKQLQDLFLQFVAEMQEPSSLENTVSGTSSESQTKMCAVLLSSTILVEAQLAGSTQPSFLNQLLATVTRYLVAIASGSFSASLLKDCHNLLSVLAAAVQTIRNIAKDLQKDQAAALRHHVTAANAPLFELLSACNTSTGRTLLAKVMTALSSIVSLVDTSQSKGSSQKPDKDSSLTQLYITAYIQIFEICKEYLFGSSQNPETINAALDALSNLDRGIKYLPALPFQRLYACLIRTAIAAHEVADQAVVENVQKALKAITPQLTTDQLAGVLEYVQHELKQRPKTNAARFRFILAARQYSGLVACSQQSSYLRLLRKSHSAILLNLLEAINLCSVDIFRCDRTTAETLENQQSLTDLFCASFDVLRSRLHTDIHKLAYSQVGYLMQMLTAIRLPTASDRHQAAWSYNLPTLCVCGLQLVDVLCRVAHELQTKQRSAMALQMAAYTGFLSNLSASFLYWTSTIETITRESYTALLKQLNRIHGWVEGDVMEMDDAVFLQTVREMLLARTTHLASSFSRLFHDLETSKTALGKYAPFLLSSSVVTLSSLMLPAATRSTFVGGLNVLLSMCTKYDSELVHATLPLEVRPLFKRIHDDYNRFHKYRGQF